MSNKFTGFSGAELNVLDEALCALTDELISDDDFYDEEEKLQLRRTRQNLLNAVREADRETDRD